MGGHDKRVGGKVREREGRGWQEEEEQTEMERNKGIAMNMIKTARVTAVYRRYTCASMPVHGTETINSLWKPANLPGMT